MAYNHTRNLSSTNFTIDLTYIVGLTKAYFNKIIHVINVITFNFNKVHMWMKI